MQGKCWLIFGIVWMAWPLASPARTTLPYITTVITKITNNTIDVVQGVTGVVQGGLNMVWGTINRIIDGAGTVRDKIIRLLEEFRKYMQRGIPELGIPILEPLTIGRLEVNIDSSDLGVIEGQATGIEIRRLSEFRIAYVNWDNRQRLTLNISFPRVDVKGKYQVSGKIANMVNLFGQGPFWLKLGGLSIATVAQLRYNINHDPPFYVSAMKINVKLKKLNSKFSNLMNDESLGRIYNEVIANVTPSALDMLWPDLEPGISRQVVYIVNDKFKIFQLSGFFGRLLNLFNFNQGKIHVHT